MAGPVGCVVYPKLVSSKYQRRCLRKVLHKGRKKERSVQVQRKETTARSKKLLGAPGIATRSYVRY